MVDSHPILAVRRVCKGRIHVFPDGETTRKWTERLKESLKGGPRFRETGPLGIEMARSLRRGLASGAGGTRDGTIGLAS